MKEKIRKTAIIICAFCFAVFSTVLYPMAKVEAAPAVGAAVPAGIVVGAGAYTVGAYALAGLVGLAGYVEYEEEINAHAANAWTNGTTLAKTSMEAMVKASIGAGNAVGAVGTDMLNWMQNTYRPDLLAKMSTLPPFTVNKGTTVQNGKDTDGTGAVIGLKMSHTLTNAKFTVNGQVYTQLAVYSLNHPNPSYREFYIQSGSNMILRRVGSSTNLSTVKVLLAMMSDGTSMTSGQFLAMMTMMGATATLTNVDGTIIDEAVAFNAAVSKVDEAWTGMRDAGLVLPVDGATSYSGDKTVTYNPSADRYTDDAGTTYAPGAVTNVFPQPRIRTTDIPVPGVYTDTPALTGNPAIDNPIIGNPAIPKTTTNVYTGTTIANPDIVTGNPAVPVDPAVPAVPGVVIPPFDAPGTTGLNFTPLMMNGTEMTKKFPFSIPFDFVRQLSVLNVKPEAPSFNINIPEFLKVGSLVVPFKMNLSFEMFDPIANVIRWGMIVIFDISLIFAIRKLLPE